MPAERWLPIDHWPYEVSDHGRVRRSLPALGTRPGRILSPFSNHKGYLFVTLSHLPRSRRVAVHHAVLAAFVGAAPGPVGLRGHEFQANHRDGDKTNNALGNLEWVTAKENYAHAVRMGLMAHGERSACAILTAAKVRDIRRRLRAGDLQRDIAADEGVGSHTISDIKHRRTWRHVA